MAFVTTEEWGKGTQGSECALADPEGEHLGPNFEIHVDGEKMEANITSHVLSVEVELTTNLASKMSLVVENRGGAFSDSAVFDLGTDVDVFLGWGEQLRRVGRFEVIRHLPSFSQDSGETLEIVGYDFSYRMMTTQTEIKGGQTKKPKRPKGKKSEAGKVWGSDKNPKPIRDILKEIADKYGMDVHVDQKSGEIEEAFIQKKGTSDWTLCQNIARIHGLRFWVDYEAIEGKGWIMHMIDPSATFISNPAYTLAYGEDGVLYSVDLEFSLPDSPSEIQCWIFDPTANDGFGEWVEIFDEETKQGKKQAKDFKKKAFSDPWDVEDLGLESADEDTVEIQDMTKFRIAVGGYSLDVLTRPFKSATEAKKYILNWWNMKKNNFVTATITLPGLETLRAFQRHEITGIGKRFSGIYMITDVIHRFDDSGFSTEAKAHKYLEGLKSS